MHLLSPQQTMSWAKFPEDKIPRKTHGGLLLWKRSAVNASQGPPPPETAHLDTHPAAHWRQPCQTERERERERGWWMKEQTRGIAHNEPNWIIHLGYCSASFREKCEVQLNGRKWDSPMNVSPSFEFICRALGALNFTSLWNDTTAICKRIVIVFKRNTLVDKALR